MLTLGARRGLTFLEMQPEVDADRLGVYGHSMGGNLTVYVVGSDQRVKAAAPSVGGSGFRTESWSLLPQHKTPMPNGDVKLFNSTVGFESYAPNIKAPLLWLGSSGRQRYNVLGALNALSHELVRVTNHTYITAETVCDLLRQIAALGLKTPITLVMDNARYQHCQLVQNLAKELGNELLFLPSYSPHLNLIERLWKFVKKDALNSRHHTNYADFHARIDQCLNELSTKHQAALATLLTPKFQTFENVPLLSA